MVGGLLFPRGAWARSVVCAPWGWRHAGGKRWMPLVQTTSDIWTTAAGSASLICGCGCTLLLTRFSTAHAPPWHELLSALTVPVCVPQT